MVAGPELKTYARRQLRERIRSLQLPCQHPHCLHPGTPVDYTTGPAAPDRRHLRYELDEITPRALGGSPTDPDNVRPVHAACNSAAGGRLRAQLHPARRPDTADRW